MIVLSNLPTLQLSLSAQTVDNLAIRFSGMTAVTGYERAMTDSLLALLARQRVALQIGTTNGGNDGSTFTQFGVVDVAMGWPLRYSHSPVEVVDLKDLVSLADMVRAVAEDW